MSQQVIKGTAKTSEAIRSRRIELGLTIEEAASRAGLGTKTWCRYEAGESIRKDKVKGICKALKWNTIPMDETENDSMFHFEEYQNHKAWSQYICECYGEAAAISFAIGSDILLDNINEDLREISVLPKGSHIGELPCSMIMHMLPEQFLTNYDYEFLYCLKTCVIQLVQMAHNNVEIIAHSVLQELAMYLIVEEAEFLMDTMESEMEECGIENLDMWKEWIFDVFDDMDIVTCLYNNVYLTPDHIYHFSHWLEEQFYCAK